MTCDKRHLLHWRVIYLITSLNISNATIMYSLSVTDSLSSNRAFRWQVSVITITIINITDVGPSNESSRVDLHPHLSTATLPVTSIQMAHECNLWTLYLTSHEIHLAMNLFSLSILPQPRGCVSTRAL